jgi:hypothetical protein
MTHNQDRRKIDVKQVVFLVVGVLLTVIGFLGGLMINHYDAVQTAQGASIATLEKTKLDRTEYKADVANRLDGMAKDTKEKVDLIISSNKENQRLIVKMLEEHERNNKAVRK